MSTIFHIVYSDEELGKDEAVTANCGAKVNVKDLVKGPVYWDDGRVCIKCLEARLKKPAKKLCYVIAGQT